MANLFLYRKILKVYNEDCTLYDTSLYGTELEIGSEEYPENISSELKFEFCWNIWLAVILVWAMLFLTSYNGVKSMKWVIRIGMPLQIIMIFVLVLTGMTLSNGDEGIQMYLSGKDDQAEE